MQMIFLLAMLLSITNQFNMCSPIILGDYSFDISTLQSQTIGLQGGIGHIDLFNCNPSTCSAAQIASTTTAMNSQPAFTLKIANGFCTPMSSKTYLIQLEELLAVIMV